MKKFGKIKLSVLLKNSENKLRKKNKKLLNWENN